jgi:HEAT repeat protein
VKSPTGVQNLLDALETPGKENLRSIALVLGWLKRSGVDRALTRLMGRVDLRDEIIEALVRHGSATVESIDRTVESGRSGSETFSRRGARTHRRLKRNACSVDTLSDESLAIDAANALGQIGDPQAVDGLLNLIGNEDASIRQAAVSALNSLTRRQCRNVLFRFCMTQIRTFANRQ